MGHSPVLAAYLNITDRRTHDLRGITSRSLLYYVNTSNGQKRFAMNFLLRKTVMKVV